MIVFTIYLAGGMSGLSFEDQYNWRREISDKLKEINNTYTVRTINPVEYYSYYRPNEYESEHEVMEFDLDKLRKSDLVIVNFNSPKSLGTMAELGIAYDRRIPVIGLNEEGHVLHEWQREMSNKIFSNMEDMITYIKNYYLI